MSEKIARLGIERDNDMMYYIKGGDVWATPRKQPGKPKGKAQKVAATGIELDYSKYLYFLDGDGDVARKARALGGGGRKVKAKKAKSVTKGANGNGTKTTKASRSSISGHYVTESTAKRHPRTTVEETVTRGKKSPEQLDREIEECLAQAKTKHGGNGGNGNGTTSAGKPAAKKKTKKRR
jgi:hypothetical protein